MGWPFRTALGIRYLHPKYRNPFFVFSFGLLASCVAYIHFGIHNGYVFKFLLLWAFVYVLWGMVLFAMSWKQGGAKEPESKFFLALFLLFAFPFIFIAGSVLSTAAKQENEER